MSDLAETAERLRRVKQATKRFLALWALEHARDQLRRGGELDRDAETVLADLHERDLSAEDWERVLDE